MSLIHLQACKRMPDTLKTAITLPSELETLTTADGSPMHIIRHATITLHLKNLIVVKSLMTDIILGIDFQREYRISYDWDKEKWCYIRHNGQFLCYTKDMESGINSVSVVKTICITPRHNGAISVSIRGHNFKTPTTCFIGSQYTDPEVKLIDGVHDISCNVTLQVLVINNSNQHVNFLKGMKIGHLEPPINELMQIPINSATTQRMLPETIKLDSFTPPKYQLDSTIQQQLDNLLGTFKDQFAKDEITIGTTLLTQMSIDTGDSDPVSQKPYPIAMKHYNWVKDYCNNQILHTNHLTTILNKDSSRTSAVSGEYCSHQKPNQRMNQCHWMTSTLRTKMYASQMTFQTGLKNFHRTDTCAFTMNTRMGVNILDCHPIQIA